MGWGGGGVDGFGALAPSGARRSSSSSSDSESDIAPSGDNKSGIGYPAESTLLSSSSETGAAPGEVGRG